MIYLNEGSIEPSIQVLREPSLWSPSGVKRSTLFLIIHQDLFCLFIYLFSGGQKCKVSVYGRYFFLPRKHHYASVYTDSFQYFVPSFIHAVFTQWSAICFPTPLPLSTMLFPSKQTGE